MSRVTIIAEAGVNHNGSLENAFKLVDAAAEAGADFVKFQTFRASKLVDASAPLADYQAKNLNQQKSQFEMLKSLELSEAEFQQIKQYCDQKHIGFASTAFDAESLQVILGLGVTFLKIPSGEIDNYFLLRAIANAGLPTVMSTGMSDMTEIRNALMLLKKSGLKEDMITILHCNTEYPTPVQDVNLKAMLTIKKELGVEVGYSDHTLGITIPIAATALGATVIEKHFTLDRNLPGPDHKASLEPAELKEMVIAIRDVEKALGTGEKLVTNSERKNKEIARRSIYVAHNLPSGHIIKEEDLVAMRPGNFLSPMEIPKIVGRRLKLDMVKGDPVKPECFEDDRSH